MSRPRTPDVMRAGRSARRPALTDSTARVTAGDTLTRPRPRNGDVVHDTPSGGPPQRQRRPAQNRPPARPQTKPTPRGAVRLRHAAQDAKYPTIKPKDLPADIILPRLRDVREGYQSTWSACCPAHA